MVRNSLNLGLMAVLMVGYAGATLADTAESPATEYRDRIKVAQTVQPLGETPFGENINLFRGGLTFRQTDVSFPGTGPTIVLSRGYVVGGASARPLTAQEAGDWNLSIPRIQTIVPGDRHALVGYWKDNRCSSFTKPSADPYLQAGMNWWHGYQMTTEEGASRTLLKRTAENTIAPSAGTHNIVTSDHWMVSCLPSVASDSPVSTGEAFLAISPDGTKYWFNYIVYGPKMETLYKEFGSGSLSAPESSPTSSTTGSTETQSPAAPQGTSGTGGGVTESSGGGGTIYYLPRKMAYALVTRIEDRHGNYVTYNYNATTKRLDSITGSDGRTVGLTWDATKGVVTTISIEPGAGTGLTQTWTYSYPGTGTTLSTVTLPDGSQWAFNLGAAATYDFASLDNEWFINCGLRTAANSAPPISGTGTITHPSGMTGSFTFATVTFGRSQVPTNCSSTGQEDIAPLFSAESLVSKTFSGPGMASQTWQYRYSDAVGSSASECAGSGPCPTSNWVEVTDPDSSITRYSHSNRWDASEGKLLSVIAGLTSGGQANPIGMQKISKTYAAYNQGPWPTRMGDSLDAYAVNLGPVERLAPETQSITELGGATFTRVTSYNLYGAPTTVARSSANLAASPGSFSRTETTAYQHDLASWVLNRPTTVTCTGNSDCGAGKEVSKTEYTAASLPWKQYAFGFLQRTMGYNANGTLASVTDGRGNAITLGNWYRGVPGTIGLPATPAFGSFGGSPASSLTAVVSPTGLISQVADQLGYPTCYSYDALGRLSGITYPAEAGTPATCNASAYNATARTFAKVAVAEYGIAAGHWVDTVTTGTGRTKTFYDAGWRPVLVLTEDTANAATRSFVVHRYDSSGRKVFTSYPVGSLTSVNDTLTGTTTQYDALGRVTHVKQDSELGQQLVTTTAYLSGLRTQVTNPRGFATITKFQAYDTPSLDSPTEIAAPESVTTTLLRQPSLAKPVAVTRSGNYSGSAITPVSRLYVYDGHERLCQTVEPESGTTVVAYDAAGNIAWSADGQASSGTTAATCENDRNNTSAADKISRSYDALNRELFRTTATGTADLATTYELDGQIASLEATQPGTDKVRTTYTYNRRRLLTREVLQVNANAPWTFDYAYNANGHLSSQTYPGNLLVGYAPDGLGRPTQAGTFAGGVTYYPNGAMSGFTYGNGIVHTMTQNARQLPATSVDSYVSGGVTTKILSDAYTYDANGNVLSLTDTSNAAAADKRTWGTDNPSANPGIVTQYDGLDRLLKVFNANWGDASNGGYNAVYSYDPLDNLRTNQLGATTLTYSYDAGNRLSSLTNGLGSYWSITTDGRGNITANALKAQAYQFDLAHRLNAVTGKESYLYDGHGRRARTLNLQTGTIEYYGYGKDGRLLQDWSNRRQVRNGYVYLGNTVVGLYEVNLTNGTVTPKYQHTDALGSPVVTTNASKTVLSRMSYTPYGLPTLPMDGVGYTGHFMDVGTGLTYMQQRYYDPQVGGFLSIDPVYTDANSGRMFNRYWYADGNPYRFTDPDGRVSKELKKLGYEDIGDGYVVRVDKFEADGQAKFEIHVYKDSADFRDAAASKDKFGLRSAEVNTLTKDGTWGKHGKGNDAPDLGSRGNAGLNKVVQRELSARGLIVRGPGGRLELTDFARRNLGKYGKFLGTAGILLEYGRSSIDRGCEVNPSGEVCR
jgi:RHS repeat-associated protein